MMNHAFARRAAKACGSQRALCAAPAATAAAVLEDVVDQARGTAFGRQHGLRTVGSLRDWKRAVPVRPYGELRPWVERQLAGEPQVLTRDEPYAFLCTSGTTGNPKLVPTTRHWRTRYRGPALYAQWGFYAAAAGLVSVPADVALDLSWERRPVRRRHGAFPVYGITERPGSLGGGDWTPPWYDAPWFTDSDRFDDLADRLYVKARLMVGHDVRFVVAVNPSKLTLLAEQVATRAEELIADVRNGRILGERDEHAPALPLVARRLEVALGCNGTLALTDLWPQLAFVACWCSASARLYQPWLLRLVPGVPILPFPAVATEGIVTLPVDSHPTAGPLAVNQGVFEFIPISLDDLAVVDVADDVETLDPQDLETGGYYRLVMSQANGLYRYLTGDVYKVVGWVGKLPRLDFVGRVGFQHSFTGEKLTDEDLHAAVATALGRGWDACPVFSCVPVWGQPPGYVLAIEWDDILTGRDPVAVGAVVDEALRGANVEYDDKRRTGRLAGLKVQPLRAGSFAGLAQLRVDSGAAATQVKHLWLQRDATLLELVEGHGLAAAALDQPPAPPWGKAG